MSHEQIEVSFVVVHFSLHYAAELVVEVLEERLHFWTLNEKLEPLVAVAVANHWV